MIIERCYPLTLKLRAPVLTQASGTLPFGTDTTLQIYHGKPVLNGSLIRGNLRHRLNEFRHDLETENPSLSHELSAGTINHWFGKPSREDLQPQRARLNFDLFWTLQNDDIIKRSIRTRIQMDASGKTRDGHLQRIDDWFPVGSEPVFSGNIHIRFEVERNQQADKEASVIAAELETKRLLFEKWLHKAVGTLNAIGSLKGIGYGKVLAATLGDVKPITQADIASWTAPPSDNNLSLDDRAQIIATGQFSITLYPDRPFCLGRPATPDSNRIVSLDYIPGNVIKAVLAKRFDDRQQKHAFFNDIAISHAQPCLSGNTARPPVIPLSLAQYTLDKGDSYYHYLVDTAAFSKPQDFAGWPDDHHHPDFLPAFLPDWKNEQHTRAEAHYPQAKPARLLTVRTAIETDGSNTAKENMLFSVECTDTEDERGNALVWRGTIDLSRIDLEGRANVLTQLESLLTGDLDNIGKTKARARVTLTATTSTYPPLDTKQLNIGDTVVITLASDCRLFAPDSIDDKLVASGSQDEVRKLYAQYFGLADFVLNDYYARQKRSGGTFHHHYYQKQNMPYSPEWLTEAGSVFVLTIDSASALTKLRDWQQQGLPPSSVKNDANYPAPDWENTPFLAEHGYGEIMLQRRDALSPHQLVIEEKRND